MPGSNFCTSFIPITEILREGGDLPTTKRTQTEEGIGYSLLRAATVISRSVCSSAVANCNAFFRTAATTGKEPIPQSGKLSRPLNSPFSEDEE